MTFTKTLISAAAVLAFAAPMAASAQVVMGDVIGEAVVAPGSDMVILRNGSYLQAQNGSAFLAGDEVFLRSGSGTINLTGCNGKFTPCSQELGAGMKVMLGTGDVCSNLGNAVRIGARDAVNSAGMEAQTVSGGSFGGGAAGGGMGAGFGGLPLAGLAAVIGAGALIAVVASDDDDDDDTPSSP